jgi:hypothetical protein
LHVVPSTFVIPSTAVEACKKKVSRKFFDVFLLNMGDVVLFEILDGETKIDEVNIIRVLVTNENVV